MILKSDLNELVGCAVVGITINPASVSMPFYRSGCEGGWILVQCRFALRDTDGDASGSASVPESAAPLLRCLKKVILDANFDKSKVLTLILEGSMFVRLLPEKDGLGSYALHTRQGILRVIDF
jgi:hypothetical protein